MDIKKIHEINLYMLKTVDNICKKYDISYRLEAGTLLGAVRHKGFIPWDDDVDIVFFRNEYEKFLTAFKKENPKYFIYDEAKNRKGFRDFIDRIFYIKEAVRESSIYKEIYDGIYQYPWIDIFVLDSINDNLFLWKINIIKQKIIYGLSMGYRLNINLKKYNLLGKIQTVILSNIGKHIKLKYLYETYEKLSKKYNNKNYKKLYYSNYPIDYLGDTKYLLDKEKEKDFIYVDFEDTKLPIVKDVDLLLKELYGEYMILPEKKYQVPSHVDIGEF